MKHTILIFAWCFTAFVLNSVSLAAAVLPNPANPALFKVKLQGTGSNAYFNPNFPYRYRKCDALGENCTAWAAASVFPNLSAGDYVFQIKDRKGCVESVSVAVNARSAFIGKPSEIVTSYFFGDPITNPIE